MFRVTLNKKDGNFWFSHDFDDLNKATQWLEKQQARLEWTVEGLNASIDDISEQLRSPDFGKPVEDPGPSLEERVKALEDGTGISAKPKKGLIAKLFG